MEQAIVVPRELRLGPEKRHEIVERSLLLGREFRRGFRLGSKVEGPLPNVVAARFTNPLHAAAYRLAFRPFAPGLEVAGLAYQALRWTTARRLIVVREELTRRPAARGRGLFYAPGYRFQRW